MNEMGEKKTSGNSFTWANALVALVLIALIPACSTTWRTLRYNAPSIKDYRIFPKRIISAPEPTLQLHYATEQGIPPAAEWAIGKDYKPGMSTMDFFDKTGTVAFLMLRNDTILYEWYDDKRTDTTTFTSFSMGKAYISMLIGIAIDEGYIKSVEDPIGDYLEYCTDSAFCHLKIRNLLQMTSGLKTSESVINPFGTTPKLYYTKDLGKVTHKLKAGAEPGDHFKYQNINYQILGEILVRATGKSIAEYLEEKIWQPLGMESDASWSLDEENGMEKAFCCLNAKARDYARFGLLMMNLGEWNGQRLIPLEWIREATAADTADGSRQHYQYHWFTSAAQEDFYAEGLLGQYTYACPSKNIVIVRLGTKVHLRNQWYDMFKILAGLTHKPEKITLPKEQLEKYEGTYVFGPSTIGDSAMAGKVAYLKRKGDGLLVKSDFNKNFVIYPDSKERFFHLKTGRRMKFEFDEYGEVKRMWWFRRGNSWWVEKE